MKQIILKSFCIFFAVMMMTMQTFAYSISTANAITQSDIQTITQFDDSEVYTAFEGVSALDQYLTVNNGTTYSEISRENSSILNGVSATTSLPLTTTGTDETAFGIPSFLWGCVLDVVGMLIVYLVTDNNKAQTKKALYGCLVGTAVEVVLYVVLFAATAATASTGTSYYGY
ncbi:MAG: hypothetical protein M1445_01985 [Bacteroidetes bacterium]|nr:hypothetical protein [Bacteroidota bacterium]